MAAPRSRSRPLYSVVWRYPLAPLQADRSTAAQSHESSRARPTLLRSEAHRDPHRKLLKRPIETRHRIREEADMGLDGENDRHREIESEGAREGTSLRERYIHRERESF